MCMPFWAKGGSAWKCPLTPGHDKVRNLGVRDCRHGLPFVGRKGRWKKKGEKREKGKGKKKKKGKGKRKKRKENRGKKGKKIVGMHGPDFPRL